MSRLPPPHPQCCKYVAFKRIMRVLVNFRKNIGAVETVLDAELNVENWIYREVILWKRRGTRRVARKFIGWGEYNNQIWTFKYLIPLVFKASSTKRAFVWRFSPDQLCSVWNQQIKSLFSFNWQVLKFVFSKFQAFILDESHPFLV